MVQFFILILLLWNEILVWNFPLYLFKVISRQQFSLKLKSKKALHAFIYPIRNSSNYCKELKKHYMMVIVMLQSNVTAEREYIFTFSLNIYKCLPKMFVSFLEQVHEPVKETYEIWIEIHSWSARKLPGVLTKVHTRTHYPKSKGCFIYFI